MKNFIFIIITLCVSINIKAQSEGDKIKQCIEDYYYSFSTADTNLLNSILSSQFNLLLPHKVKESEFKTSNYWNRKNKESLLDSLNESSSLLQYKILNGIKLKYSSGISQSYIIYQVLDKNNTLVDCGRASFQIVKESTGFKIISILQAIKPPFVVCELDNSNK